MATLSSVQMGSQATPSVRIPPEAVPRPAAASPLPALRGRLGGAGARSVQASEPAWRRGARYRSPAAQPTQPGGLGASPAWPSFRRAGRRVPKHRVPGARAPREGEVVVVAATAALTIAGRQALPGARVPKARTRGLDFTSIPFCPVPPFSGPLLLRLLPVFPRLPLAWSLRVSLSSLSSFSSSWSSSSPPPPSLQKERKV